MQYDWDEAQALWMYFYNPELYIIVHLLIVFWLMLFCSSVEKLGFEMEYD